MFCAVDTKSEAEEFNTILLLVKMAFVCVVDANASNETRPVAESTLLRPIIRLVSGKNGVSCRRFKTKVEYGAHITRWKISFFRRCKNSLLKGGGVFGVV